MKKLFSVTTLFAVTLVLGGCGYNDLQRQDEQTKAAWSEVLTWCQTWSTP
jgi:LemA protein